MLTWSEMLERSKKYSEANGWVWVFVCMCESKIPAEWPFFILAQNKELSILSFSSALDNHFNSNLMKVSLAVGEMGIHVSCLNNWNGAE